MNRNALQVVVVILIIALAGLMYYQYTKAKQEDENSIRIETPAGTFKTEFESKDNAPAEPAPAP